MEELHETFVVGTPLAQKLIRNKTNLEKINKTVKLIIIN